MQVRAIRVSFVGELGWELHVPKESCSAVYRALIAESGDGQLINAGYRAIDSLSIEKGYPHWHAEIRYDGGRELRNLVVSNVHKDGPKVL